MGIAVLSFFSSGILVILILMCGIAVSSSLAIIMWFFIFFVKWYSVKEDLSCYCGAVHLRSPLLNGLLRKRRDCS